MATDAPVPVDKERAQRLIDVLKSGKYKQGRRALQSDIPNSKVDKIIEGGEYHCCIHVAYCEFGNEMTLKPGGIANIEYYKAFFEWITNTETEPDKAWGKGINRPLIDANDADDGKFTKVIGVLEVLSA